MLFDIKGKWDYMEPDLKNIEIIEKTEGINLSNLSLSVRLYNCLKRGGYNTLTEVMLEYPDKLKKIRNFGHTSEQELSALRGFVHSSDRDTILKTYAKGHGHFSVIELSDLPNATWTVLETAFNKKIGEQEIVFINGEGDYCSDISINEIVLSVRTMNALLSEGINSFLKVSMLPFSRLSSVKSMGQKSINELLEVIRDRTIISDSSINVNNSIDEKVQKIKEFFSPIIDNSVLSEKELIHAVVRVCGTEIDNNSLNETFLVEIAKSNPIKREIRKMILATVPDKIYFGIDRGILITLVAKQDSRFHKMVDNIIEDLIADNQIRLIYGKLFKYKLFLDEWIDTLQGTCKAALECRFQGMTLEETGGKLGLTRERIRQIVAKAVNRCPKIYEDDFKEFIESYFFTKEEFCSLLNLTICQINYLLLSYKRGSRDLQAFLDDDMVPAHFKENVPSAFRGKVLVLDGECILLKRDVLLQKLLKLFYSDKDCSVEEFAEFYSGFLNENHIADFDNLRFPNLRALEARILDNPYTIAKTGRNFRYYDTDAININELLESIEIGKYENIEISTLKLIRDWPDVMEQYDIRDEYELHNLIRKKIGEIENYPISVTRMPFITIGNGDRTKQVEELLLQMAPVTNIELAAVYEKQYGVRQETVLANFLKCIDIYYHDGIFDLELQDLTLDEYDVLHCKLTEDVYLWDTIVQIYYSISSDPKLDAINSMTLRKLGFRVYSQYVIKANYPSADAFFTQLLLKNRILDINELPNWLRTIQVYYSVLTELRDALELIEVKKDLFFRFDYFLEFFGIKSKDQLINLGDEVLSRMNDMEYISVDAIVNNEEMNDFPEFVRNPFVLNSILRVLPEIKTIRISNTYIATKKKNELSQLGLITYVITKEGGMIVSDLVEILHSKYCLNLDKSRILYVIENSEFVIYDDIFDYVCLRTEWDGYIGPVYLSETRFFSIINENKSAIENSCVLIAKVYWKDKYAEFVDYCGMNECFEMKDILKLDFRKLYDNVSRLNLSRGAVINVVNMFIKWVNDLSMSEIAEQESESIVDLFFK